MMTRLDLRFALLALLLAACDGMEPPPPIPDAGSGCDAPREISVFRKEVYLTIHEGEQGTEEASGKVSEALDELGKGE